MSATTHRSTKVHHRGHHARQRGMGATIILFTIALIVLVGAALAYASRGNPSATSGQGGKVYAGLLLKQSADYHDAYSRYVFDGGNAGTMTFTTTPPPPSTANELFNPTNQYGSYVAPPPQAVTTGTPVWKYQSKASVPGVGAGGVGNMIYVLDLTKDACQEVNHQLYGTRSAPTGATSAATLAGAGPVTLDATLTGRAIGCYLSSADTNYVFYAMLNEG